MIVGITQIKEIILRNKTKIKVSNIHPLYILGDDGFPVWKQAKDIKIGDKALFSMRGNLLAIMIILDLIGAL